MSVADETARLAWQVLRTANRTQTKGSSVRLVVPRAPEVVVELESSLDDAEILTVEEFLLEYGYVAPTNIGLTRGSYTITPAGFHWLEGGLPELSRPPTACESLPASRVQKRRLRRPSGTSLRRRADG